MVKNSPQIEETQYASLGVDVEIQSGLKLAIGIVFFNNSEREMLDVFDGIARSIDINDIKVQVFCINNGEPFSQEALELIQHYQVTEVPSLGNIGSANAHNQLMKAGFDEFGADAYITMNPDGALHPRALSRMLKMCQYWNFNAVIEAAQFPHENAKKFNLKNFDTDWAVTACTLFPRICWEKVGGFDENIFLYCDDVDYSWQIRLADISIKYCPWAYFYHDFAGERTSDTVLKYKYLGGRYLGHKWRGKKFQTECEDKLIELGFYVSSSDMPPLTQDCIIRKTKNIPKLSKQFYFANRRW